MFFKNQKRIKELEKTVARLEKYIVSTLCHSKGGICDFQYSTPKCKIGFISYNLQKTDEGYEFIMIEEKRL